MKSRSAPLADILYLGIAHHSPVCAKSVRAALEHYQPEAVLIEGPVEANRLLQGTLARWKEFVPPVGLLTYLPKKPNGPSLLFPLAAYSPEWQALRWAAQQQRTVAWIDLSLEHRLAHPAETVREEGTILPSLGTLLEQLEDEEPGLSLLRTLEQEVTLCRQSFAMLPMMSLRERWMQREIHRYARRYRKLAVVVGAWHLQALRSSRFNAVPELPPRFCISDACWVPLSSEALRNHTGYDAGVRHPRWQQLLFDATPSTRTIVWMTQQAWRSQAILTEAQTGCQLAKTLAELRGLPHPDLDVLEDTWRALHPAATTTEPQQGSIPLTPDQPPLLQDFHRRHQRYGRKPGIITLRRRDPRDQEQLRFYHLCLTLGLEWPVLVPPFDDPVIECWQTPTAEFVEARLLRWASYGTTLETVADTSLLLTTLQANPLGQLIQWRHGWQAGRHDVVKAQLQRWKWESTLDTETLGQLLEEVSRWCTLVANGDMCQLMRSLQGQLYQHLMVHLQAGEELSADRLEGLIVVLPEAMLEPVLHLASHQGGYSAGLAVRWLLLHDRGEINNLVPNASSSPEVCLTWWQGLLGASLTPLLISTSLCTQLRAWVAKLDNGEFLRHAPFLRSCFHAVPLAQREQLLRQIQRHDLTNEEEARWLLVLGTVSTTQSSVLNELYAPQAETLDALFARFDGAGQGISSPFVARWLDLVGYAFPSLQTWLIEQAIDRWRHPAFALSPHVAPHPSLLIALLTHREHLPPSAMTQARHYVAACLDQLRQHYLFPLQRAIFQIGKWSNCSSARPDFPRTIMANLQHYQPSLKTIVPETLYWQRTTRGLEHLILCLDQSGSMMKSLVYAGTMASFLASLPSLRTNIVVYDTNVVDLTELAREDPVSFLFGLQLGGGNDTARALRYCGQLVQRPRETLLVLLSDLLEGALSETMLEEIHRLHQQQVKVLVLLAITDAGQPEYHHGNARKIAAMGIPVTVSTPDRFAEVLEKCWQGRD